MQELSNRIKKNSIEVQYENIDSKLVFYVVFIKDNCSLNFSQELVCRENERLLKKLEDVNS
jgi:hypothetical protein